MSYETLFRDMACGELPPNPGETYDFWDGEYWTAAEYVESCATFKGTVHYARSWVDGKVREYTDWRDLYDYQPEEGNA